MLCLSGFELYSRWVPLTTQETMDSHVLQDTHRTLFSSCSYRLVPTSKDFSYTRAVQFP